MGNYGDGVVINYTTTPVGTTNWVVVIPNLATWATAFNIFDSSGGTLELGVCAAGATTNSEIRQALIPPGGTFQKLPIPMGSRVSIRAVGTPATSGASNFNLIY